jgi:hypothetical protein
MLGFLIFVPEKGAVFSVPAPYHDGRRTAPPGTGLKLVLHRPHQYVRVPYCSMHVLVESLQPCRKSSQWCLLESDLDTVTYRSYDGANDRREQPIALNLFRKCLYINRGFPAVEASSTSTIFMSLL